MTLHFI